MFQILREDQRRRFFVCLMTTVWVIAFSSTSGAADNLLAKVREEKKVVLYNTTNIPDTQKIVEGFRKLYPYLEVESFRSTGEKLIQRISAEVPSGHNLADVYLISGLQTWLLKGMGYMAPYNSPGRDKVDPALKDRAGYWTGVYWNLEVLGYNTKLVAQHEVPRRWEDLLSSRWKGRVALESEDVNWYLSILKLMGEEKGRDFMTKLARQQIQLRSGHTLLGQLLTAGEFAIAPTLRVHQVETLKKNGAPVEWTAIEPLAPNPPVCVSLPKNPPHPNAARIFIDYLLSQEGQTVVSKMDRNPSRTDVAQPVPRVSKIKLLELDYEPLTKQYSRYTKEYRDFFGVRGKE